MSLCKAMSTATVRCSRLVGNPSWDMVACGIGGISFKVVRRVGGRLAPLSETTPSEARELTILGCSRFSVPAPLGQVRVADLLTKLGEAGRRRAGWDQRTWDINP